MIALKWKKTYKGPFNKHEADILVKDFKECARPEENGIYDSATRRRRGQNMYDVYIKIPKEIL